MRGAIITLIFLLLSCREPYNPDSWINMDLKPPVLEEISISESRCLKILFDEEITFSGNEYRSDPELPLEKWSIGEKCLTLFFSKDQDPGRMYKCRADVQDKSGNTLSFMIRFYGWNDNLPEVLINEFNPEGSGNNPDTVELYVRKGGSTAGLTLFLGTSEHFSQFYVCPDLTVQAGDYIIIHMRPEGISGEIDESTDKAESEGKLASDSAWDLWAEEDKPISGSNGLITLYTNPFGSILDAVPYSNRLTADSEEYRGWTAATFDMIEELSFMNVWESTEGFIRPEDAVSSAGTTGTRSICRNSISFDSDRRSDWHIVPTGQKSFGEANSDEIYEP